jgi:putative addiction module component (TIGR02574 family)
VSAKSAALRNEVLALPTEERAELAAELLASLDDVDDADPGEVDRLWGEELVRRSAQLAAGEVTGLSWDQVLERVAENRRPR